MFLANPVAVIFLFLHEKMGKELIAVIYAIHAIAMAVIVLGVPYVLITKTLADFGNYSFSFSRQKYRKVIKSLILCEVIDSNSLNNFKNQYYYQVGMAFNRIFITMKYVEAKEIKIWTKARKVYELNVQKELVIKYRLTYKIETDIENIKKCCQEKMNI